MIKDHPKIIHRYQTRDPGHYCIQVLLYHCRKLPYHILLPFFFGIAGQPILEISLPTIWCNLESLRPHAGGIVWLLEQLDFGADFWWSWISGMDFGWDFRCLASLWTCGSGNLNHNSYRVVDQAVFACSGCPVVKPLSDLFCGHDPWPCRRICASPWCHPSCCRSSCCRSSCCRSSCYHSSCQASPSWEPACAPGAS